MICLFHSLTDFLQSIEEAGFHRRQRESQNLGHIGKTVVAIDSESDYFGLLLWNFGKKLNYSLIVRFVVF